jgi:hypothetical protein
VPLVPCEGEIKLPDKIIAYLYAGKRRKYYAVADYRNILLARGVDKGDGEVHIAEIIAHAVPVWVNVVERPRGVAYLVLWRDGIFGDRWLEGTLRQIAGRIRRTTPIINHRYFFGVFRAIINEMLDRGLTSKIEEID